MSLFGASPDDSGSAKPNLKQQSKSLFEDEQRPASNASNSLFADDGSNESPWSIPTPKKAGRAELIRNLIPGSSAPESYVDAFDTILESGEGANGKMSSAGVAKLMQNSGVPSTEQSSLVRIVAPDGGAAAGVDRNTFNVLMALIGLSQEGEEATLDGVDERKRSGLSSRYSYWT